MDADGDWLDRAIALDREEQRQEEERRRREEEEEEGERRRREEEERTLCRTMEVVSGSGV